MPRTLYELANVESPFVWRAKYALAHKGLAYQTQRTAFTAIATTCEGRHPTVPFLVDENGSETCDSMHIAAYLDDAYPDTPSLLGDGALERAQEIEGILGKTGFPNFFPLYIHDIWAGLPEKDAAYFRSSREARFGTTLESLSAEREARLPAARAALDPLRAEIAKAPWLNGDTPGYADYIVLAFFAWLKGCATTPPLAKGDPLLAYIDRGFALYGDIAKGIDGGPLG